MNQPLYRQEFLWEVCEAGYTASPVMVGFAIAPAGPRFRAYRPEPDVFVQLAQVDPGSSEQMVEFANQFGQLQPPRPKTHPLGPEKGPHIEASGDWAREIKNLRLAISLWQQITTGDAATLAPRLQWQKKFVLLKDELLDEPLLLPVEECPTRDVIAVARKHLETFINTALEGVDLVPRLRLPAAGKPNYSLRYRSLAEFCWENLAASIGAGATFKDCLACGRLMLVSPEGTGFRARRESCNDTCRMKLNYGRRVIGKMREDGATDEVIAQRLNISVEQVSRWSR